MQAELIEIKQFLLDYAPFNLLPEETVDELVSHIEISYSRTGDVIVSRELPPNDLFIVRSGAVEIYRRKGELYNRLSQGDIFGQMGLLTNNKVIFPVKAIEDSLLYCIPSEQFHSLYNEHEAFAEHMEVDNGTRLRQAVLNTSENDLTTAKVTSLLSGTVNSISDKTSVEETAKVMAEDNISSLLVLDSESNDDDVESEHGILGIVTDRDLCTRVLAQGVDPKRAIRDVVTTELVYLDHNAYVYEATLTMLRHKVNHLPILKNGKPIGVLETADLVRYESQSSLLLVNSIFQQNSVDELAQVAMNIKDSFVRMVNEDANAHMIGSAMSVIGRSIKQRLVELAEIEYGPSPVPFCFLALGSMGRDEQLLVTDQDNAIILDNRYEEKRHGDYFAKLANFVCDGLDACGYSYCTGEIMASNPKWRMTRQQWEEHFGNWIDDPNPHALLNASIFFDLVGVYGEIKWADQLNKFIVKKAKSNKRFLACLARNALNRTPPLGFFKNFVMEKDGRHNNSFNLKRRGTAPLADIIRVHALAIGSSAKNSFERLEDVIEANILPKGRGADLRDAMELISMVRIRHQAYDVNNGIEPDNNIEPENLSDFERRNLKDAFQVVSNAQNFLKYRYQAGKSGL